MGHRQAEAFENNRLSIIETAELLIARNGIEGTSLADISKSLGISKGTLYYYYPSKEHLVNDIAEHYLEHVTDRLFYWIESVQPQAEITSVLWSLIESFTGDTDYAKTHAVLIKEAAMGHEGIRRKFVAKYREWSVMMEVGILKAAAVDPQKLRTASYLFFACMDGLINQNLLGADKLNNENLVQFFIAALGLPPEGQAPVEPLRFE